MKYKQLAVLLTCACACAGQSAHAASDCVVNATVYAETTDGFIIGSNRPIPPAQTHSGPPVGKIVAVEFFVQETIGITASGKRSSGEWCPIGPMTQAFACPAAKGGYVTLDTQGSISSLGCNNGSTPVQLTLPANLSAFTNPLPLALPSSPPFPFTPGNYYEVSPIKGKWTSIFPSGKPATYNASFHIYCVEGYCANGNEGGVMTNGSVTLSAGPYFASLIEVAGAPIVSLP